MILFWGVFVFEALLALGLVVAAVLYKPRIGGYGPYLLAIVPLIDVVIGGSYRAASLVMMTRGFGGSGWTLARMKEVYDVIDVAVLFLMMLSAAILVLAFALMRKGPEMQP